MALWLLQDAGSQQLHHWSFERAGTTGASPFAGGLQSAARTACARTLADREEKEAEVNSASFLD